MAKSTMGSKARQVRDLLRIDYFSPEFQRADVAAENPMVWMLEVNGLVMDARHVPLEIQVEAFQRGLIPYMPRSVQTARQLLRVTGNGTPLRPSEAVALRAADCHLGRSGMSWPTTVATSKRSSTKGG